MKYRENLNKEFKHFRDKGLIYEGYTINKTKINVLFNLRKVTIEYINDNIVSIFIGDLYGTKVSTNAVIMRSILVKALLEERDYEIL